MTDPLLPLLVEPEQLEASLTAKGLLVVDLCHPQTYAEAHVPGAIHLDYADIIAMEHPVGGLIPDKNQLTEICRAIGLTPQSHVVSYDDEGGGRAARFLYTLDVIGHPHYSLLNGGLIAWRQEERSTTKQPTTPQVSDYTVDQFDQAPIADRDYILAHLNDNRVKLLDARSPAEYSGDKKFAARGGHIPGAINFDWMNALDRDNHFRLRAQVELKSTLAELGITSDKEIIVYCQTHHRSSHTYYLLKLLGFDRVRGYPGSWSDWGNQNDTPIE